MVTETRALAAMVQLNNDGATDDGLALAQAHGRALAGQPTDV
jgi:hypothetical protein